MAYDFNLIENMCTLSYFDYLKKEKLEPELAVFQGRTLWIVSQKTSNVMEKIIQIFVTLRECILLWTGDLSYNKDKIEEIKAEVEAFHLEKCKHLFVEKIPRQIAETEALGKRIDEFKKQAQAFKQDN